MFYNLLARSLFIHPLLIYKLFPYSTRSAIHIVYIQMKKMFHIQLFHVQLFHVQIRVNSINPTVVLTALAKRSGWDKPDVGGEMVKRTPLGRYAGTYSSSQFFHFVFYVTMQP